MATWILLLTFPLIHFVNFAKLFDPPSPPGLLGLIAQRAPGFLSPSLTFSQWTEAKTTHTDRACLRLWFPRKQMPRQGLESKQFIWRVLPNRGMEKREREESKKSIQRALMSRLTVQTAEAQFFWGLPECCVKHMAEMSH